MNKKTIMIRTIQIFAFIMMLAFAIGAVPASSYAATVKTSSLSKIKKEMQNTKVKKLQYHFGKWYTTKNRYWKTADELLLSAASLKIRKKGWYTIRITDTSNKKTLFRVKLKKKTYKIKFNESVAIKAGFYYLVPGVNTKQVLEVQNASTVAGGNVAVYNMGTPACRVWQLESAGGKKFRIKNVNSGLYMGAETNQNDTAVNVIQKAYQASDKTLVFEAAAAGKGFYYIKCTANGTFLQTKGTNIQSSKRRNTKSWKIKLTAAARPVSEIGVTGYTYPTTLLNGSAFAIKGTVASKYTITSVSAGIINSSGTSVLKKTVSPNRCYYSLSELDRFLTFGKLAIGTYCYQVTVSDKSGTTKTIINRSFTVLTPTVNSGKILLYNSAFINAIGHQSTGTSLEKTACASYALAYCNSILYGTTPSPHTYWISSTVVDCVWGKGGYATYSYGSENAVLQAAYGQLTEGKPCILHVTGNTSQHWVALIGYKNISSLNTLSEENFIAIDPWNGNVITVSDSYKVKSTYRLGYQA